MERGADDRPASVIGFSLESTRADSAAMMRPASVTSLRMGAAGSEDAFDSNIDEISESGLSFSISMVQDKLQADMESEMKKLWAQTEAEVARLNKDRDEKVEGLLERFAEQKFEQIAQIRHKYEA